MNNHSNRDSEFLLSFDNKLRSSKNENELVKTSQISTDSKTDTSTINKKNEYAKNSKSFDRGKQKLQTSTLITSKINKKRGDLSQENNLLLFDQEPVNSYSYDISLLSDFDPILNGDTNQSKPIHFSVITKK